MSYSYPDCANPHPHDQHAYQHKEHWHHILEDPGPSVSHEVKSSFIQQSNEVLEELGDSVILVDLHYEVKGGDVRRYEKRRHVR
jgi:hypothetical protein